MALDPAPVSTGFPHRDRPVNVVKFHSDGDIPFGVFAPSSPFSIFVDASEWPTAEHYYHAQKFSGMPFEERVKKAATPSAACALARGQGDMVRKDWPAVREEILERALYAKFTQHEDLRVVLMSTGNAEIQDRSKSGAAMEPGLNPEWIGSVLQRVRQQVFYNVVGRVQRTLLKLPRPDLEVCPKGKECRRIDDPIHTSEAAHPCPRGEGCTDSSPWHLKHFRHMSEAEFMGAGRDTGLPAADLIVQQETIEGARPKRLAVDPSDDPDHLPICPFMFDCKLQQIPGHETKYSHICTQSSTCTNKTPFHRSQYFHPNSRFLPECPDGEVCRRCSNVYHVMAYTHPCATGVRCNIFTPVHLELHTHKIPPCPQGKTCWRKKEKKHASEYSHPCPKGEKCPKKEEIMHSRMFTHTVVNAEEAAEQEAAKREVDEEEGLHQELFPQLAGSRGSATVTATTPGPGESRDQSRGGVSTAT